MKKVLMYTVLVISLIVIIGMIGIIYAELGPSHGVAGSGNVQVVNDDESRDDRMLEYREDSDVRVDY